MLVQFLCSDCRFYSLWTFQVPFIPTVSMEYYVCYRYSISLSHLKTLIGKRLFTTFIGVGWLLMSLSATPIRFDLFQPLDSEYFRLSQIWKLWWCRDIHQWINLSNHQQVYKDFTKRAVLYTALSELMEHWKGSKTFVRREVLWPVCILVFSQNHST